MMPLDYLAATSDYVVILLCAEFLVTAVSFKCCSVKGIINLL